MNKTLSRRQALIMAATLTVAACTGTGTPPAATPAASSVTTPTAGTAMTTPAAGGTIDYTRAGIEGTALNGAGASFPDPLYKRWFADFSKLTNTQINYQAVGSGAGINQYTQKTVDFGATDGPMTAAQLQAAPNTLHIPMTAGPVALIFNIPELAGLKPGEMKFTAETVSGIYLGTITRWNDAKIKADNPNAALPDKEIVRVRRSDSSGTTNIFTSYLAAVSEEWKTKVGSGANSVEWEKVGQTIGGAQNAGVAGAVQQTPYSIGYVEVAFAKQNKLVWGTLKNKAGNFVEPTLEGTTAAIQGTTIPDDYRVSIVNSADPKAYPIAGLTWILANKTQADARKGKTLVHLLWWCLHEGQAIPGTGDLEYAKLPDTLIKRVEATLRSITGPDGKSLLG